MSMRTRISLDGQWQFQFTAEAETDLRAIEQWRSAHVPLPWQAQFADLRYSSGIGWYRRTVTLNDSPNEAAQAIMLHFGAVDYHATVWINGKRAGEHEGGYLPFTVDITTMVRAGDNEIVVRAADPTDDAEQWPTYTFSEIPHGKQSWYGPISGIWQSVWLEARAAIHFRHLRLTPNPNTKSIEIDSGLSQALPADWTIQRQLYAPDGALLLEETVGGDAPAMQLHEAPQRWSPEQPNLYTVQLQLHSPAGCVDELEATCGFRTVEARDGRIYLNDEPIYLRGALDQAYYPETIYTPPTLEFLEDQIHKAKALGLNCLRCHIKIEDPRYYEVADRLGMLIWTEIPNWIQLSAGASQRVKETFLRMVERDWNHPSIIAWTLVNENWGTDLTHNPEHRHWLASFYREAKQIDPHRLIVDNSACRGNLHVAGDLEDFHHYRAIPDHAAEWDEWVADFASRPEWVWAADYAAERRPDLPLLVSEFGNWGLPHPDAIQEGGEDPWWFENGLEWGEGIVYPHGMRQRFTYWGLDRVFGDLTAFTEAHQEHMARSLAYELTTMRMHHAIGGYVITEFTDVHWECNGLMDMQRNIKHGLDRHFTPLNQEQIVAARPQRWSGEPGELVAVTVETVGTDGPVAAGTIHWQTTTHKGEIPAPGGTVTVPLTEPGMSTVHFTWAAADGVIVARNQVELACVAPKTAASKLHVVGNEALAATLRDLGYTLTTEVDAILVANDYTQELREAVQQGAMLLLLLNGETEEGEDTTGALTTVSLPNCRPVARAGTGWQGDWATSFSWLRKEGPFDALPGPALLEMEYAAVMPNLVLSGIPARAFPHTSWAGLALGWIHKPVSLLHKAPYGNGTIVTTTFQLTAATLQSNVVARALFAGCVELAAS